MKYQINKGYVSQKIDKQTVIFDGENSILYTFNETASLVFALLKKGLSDKEIIQRIVGDYEVNPENAQADFKKLLSDLIAKKIVVPSSKSSDRK